MFKNIYLCSKKYIFMLKNIYLISKYIFIFKKIYIHIQKYWFIYVQKIYIYVPKNIPEQFTAIGQPSFIRGGGVGEGAKKGGTIPEASAWGVFVRRFRRRFRPEEFSSAGDLLWRPTQLYLKRRGWEGRVDGRGKKVLIIALLLLYDASGKCSSIKVFSIFARKLALTSHRSVLTSDSWQPYAGEWTKWNIFAFTIIILWIYQPAFSAMPRL